MKVQSVFTTLLHRASGRLRERGRVLKKFADQLGFVHFGMVNQHDDDHSAIRGFTASITHNDSHYIVGTYKGYDVRFVNRFDILTVAGKPNHQQLWTVLEIKLKRRGLPHVFFVPTGHDAGEYARLYATQLHFQPLNTLIGMNNRSPEFHGRYQIMARPTHAHEIEHLFDSPTIVGIGTKFWPNGIEVDNDTLYVYMTRPHLTKMALEVSLTSALWLADGLDNRQ